MSLFRKNLQMDKSTGFRGTGMRPSLWKIFLNLTVRTSPSQMSTSAPNLSRATANIFLSIIKYRAISNKNTLPKGRFPAWSYSQVYLWVWSLIWSISPSKCRFLLELPWSTTLNLTSYHWNFTSKSRFWRLKGTSLGSLKRLKLGRDFPLMKKNSPKRNLMRV